MRACASGLCSHSDDGTSSPPTWTKSPGKRSSTSDRTSSRNANVESFTFRMSSWMPTVVATGIGTPVLPSSGYDAIAELMWPGMSISGTIRTWRAAANATTSRTSSCV